MNEFEYEKRYKYDQLCDIFDLEHKRGSGQQTQINQISKKYDIEKTSKNYYIIHKEYSNIEIAENNKYHKYKNYIEPMLYTILSQPKNNVIRMDMHELMEFLGIVNKDYHYAKYHAKECEQLIKGGNINSLEIFSRESEPMLKRIVIDVLKEMQEKCLVEVNMIPMFAKKYRDNDNGKIYTKIWEANKKDEIPKLLEAKRIALNNFNIKYWNELQYFQFGEAKDIVANELQIDYFYYEYEIILNKTGLKELITENYSDLKKSLNSYIQEKTKRSRRGDLKILSSNEKDTYVNYLINIDKDYKLRLSNKGGINNGN